MEDESKYKNTTSDSSFKAGNNIHIGDVYINSDGKKTESRHQPKTDWINVRIWKAKYLRIAVYILVFVLLCLGCCKVCSYLIYSPPQNIEITYEYYPNGSYIKFTIENNSDSVLKINRLKIVKLSPNNLNISGYTTNNFEAFIDLSDLDENQYREIDLNINTPEGEKKYLEVGTNLQTTCTIHYYFYYNSNIIQNDEIKIN
jgi:hypothetical protein